MLIPTCSERLPVRFDISQISARGLPVMNKYINSTDAFVELRFADDVQKTDVVTSLSPEWDSDPFEFDTDEKELSEELLHFRVMDHDTYTANDAIGRVQLDCNIIIEKLRIQGKNGIDELVTLPIYDTVNGLRGELLFRLRLQLLMHADFSHYVQIFSGYFVPCHLQVVEVVGLIHQIKIQKDPDYEWLDRIRSPRATNEARQSAIRVLLRDAALSLSIKADKLLCNFIFGYQEYVDVEGSSSDFITVRVCGTAVRLVSADQTVQCSETITFPLLSIGKVPCHRQIGIGTMVAARAIHLLDDAEDSHGLRKRWWNEMRSELYQQAASMGCNVVISYTEQMTVNEGIALMECNGTAVLVERTVERPRGASICVSSSVPSSDFDSSVISETKETKKGKENKRADSCTVQCGRFHTTITDSKQMFKMKSLNCVTCKSGAVSDFVLSTTMSPSPQYYIGPRSYVQVSVSKKVSSDPSDTEEYATEIGNLLPFADHELFNNLLGEVKSVNGHANAVFDLRCSYHLSDDLLVCVVTGIALRLSCIPKEDSIGTSAFQNVLSFSNLQKYNDARRFSWGTVREAIRFKPSVLPGVTLKILNLKPPMMESLDDSTQSKSRYRINTFVDKMRKRHLEKEYISHVVFERQVSTSIGFLDNSAANMNAIAGLHFSPNLHNLVLSREQADGNMLMSRWSDVFVREDLSTSVKDSTAVDGFVNQMLEERLSTIRAFAALGGPSITGTGTVSNLRISCPQFSISKEHAHIIVLMSCDINA